MKKIFYLMISALILCTSCKDDEKDFQTFGVKIQLAYPQGSPFKPTEGIRSNPDRHQRLGLERKNRQDRNGLV